MNHYSRQLPTNYREIAMEPKLKSGIRVRLISMPQDTDPIPVGTLGTVLHVHAHRGRQQVEVAWNKGRQLMLAMPDDCVEVVS